MSRSKMFKKFKEGQELFENGERLGCSIMSLTDTNVIHKEFVPPNNTNTTVNSHFYLDVSTRSSLQKDSTCSIRPMEGKRFFAARQCAFLYCWNCDPVFSTKTFLCFTILLIRLIQLQFFVSSTQIAHEGRTLL